MGIYSILLEVSIAVARHLSAGALTNTARSDEEEDDVTLTSVCDRAAVDFLFSRKRLHSLIIHPFIAGLLSYAGCLLLLSSVLLESLPIPGVVFVFIIGWYVQCSAHYSLSVSAPAELAVYRPIDTLELRFVTRPFYIVTIAAIFIGTRIAVLQPVLYLQLLYSFLCLLPLGWAVGFLPPLDALTVWTLEQLLVRIMGGSPMATDFRLLVQVVLSTIPILTVSVLTDPTLSALLATSFGFILSHNLFLTPTILTSSLLSLCPLTRGRPKSPSTVRFASLSGIDCRSTHTARVYLLYWIGSLLKDTVLLGVGLVTIYYTLAAADVADRQLALSVTGGLLLGALVLVWVSDSAQGVYVLGLLRNPLHPWTCDNVARAKTRRRRLHYLAIPRAVTSHFILLLLLLSYIGLGLRSEVTLAPPGWAWIPISRILRLAWQDTHRAHRDLSLVALLHFIVPQIDTSLSLGPATQALVFGEALSILKEFFFKVWFATTLFLTFIASKKQRTHTVLSMLIITGTFLLLPFILLLLLFSSIVSTPLLPLFTLPLFSLSFPRPRRFWPGLVRFGTQYTRCADSVYYEQARDEVAMAIRHSIRSGAVSGSPGTQVLVRFANRTILCTVLESGHGFSALTLRGLELQETSCHTVEANRVDEMFEGAYRQSSTGCCKFLLNTHFLSSLQPKDLAVIQTYSDAKNVLTGIIDQGSALERFSGNLLKTLVWVLYHHYRLHAHSTLSPHSDTGHITTPPHMTQESVAVSDHAPVAMSDHAPPHAVLEDNDSWAESVSTIDRYPPHDLRRVVRLTSDISLPSLPSDHAHLESGTPSRQRTEDIFLSPSEVDLPSFPPSRSTGIPEGRVPGGHGSRRGSARVQPLTLEMDGVPQRWSKPPLSPHVVSQLLARFPSDWYGFIDNLSSGSSPLTVGAERELCALVMVCHALVDTPTITGLVGGGKRLTTPFDVYQGFNGEFPYSAHLSWLTEDQLLRSLVLRAYRYTVKLLYDEGSLGELDSHSELADQLLEFDSQCFIGSEAETGWEESVLQRVPRLFSMARNKDDGVYTARVLTLQDQLVHIGELNPESVRGVWSDLSLELLFLTNDDDERYSIQAHPAILRNLTIQMSEPPLGYSIHSSGLLSLP